MKLIGDNNEFGIGEIGPLKGLSIDDRPDLEKCIDSVCHELEGKEIPQKEALLDWLKSNIDQDFPSIRFGVETAILDLLTKGNMKVFDCDLIDSHMPIPINGLVWMGDESFMIEQIEAKLRSGFDCIKMKIGAIDFETEIKLLKSIRDRYTKDEIVLRVDANGAFSPRDALNKLEILSSLDIHSIEQPIKAGQIEEMSNLCNKTPLPIALDEELIGIDKKEEKAILLDRIQPQFIILKPTLVGGNLSAGEWIELAEERNTGWWMTSALESNVGLNAIAQYTSYLHTAMPQGLGTGQLYYNNIESPLVIEQGKLKYDHSLEWNNPFD
ncbi:o-succinylbenzoate synthase [Aureibacter tunicatorum]|uniref:L-alanine-DL-glutamate epimerase-like enolase superfamily enzyme n=1 Tax=Aureibacter tunicatorum TaxID=866807 RepID=A0AAE4BTM1_9BACT|nr:o-succinylbenzoate synthase [Aureibacter tunicatorum]MDR6239787.1 L-alanine-DL-glutamate epimerase-like enolase superfamily enzyme [Aureibacter tunicatorum]